MLAPATTEAVLDRLGFAAAPAPDPDGLAARVRGVVRARAVRQSGEADPPRGRQPDADSRTAARSVLRVVPAPRHRRHVLAVVGRRCTRCSTTLGFDARRGSARDARRPHAVRSTPTARCSCASTASTTGSTRRCSPSACSRSSPGVPTTARRSGARGARRARRRPVARVVDAPVPRRDARLPPARRRRDRRALPRALRVVARIEPVQHRALRDPQLGGRASRSRSVSASNARADGMTSRPARRRPRRAILVEEFGYSEAIVAALPARRRTARRYPRSMTRARAHYETTDVRIDKIVVGPLREQRVRAARQEHRRRGARRRRQRARAAARGVTRDRRAPRAHDARPLRPHPGRHADARRGHRRRHRDRRREDAAGRTTSRSPTTT